ncbi:MAG: lysylphosphatidylglycerol synthase transmembrane domain-containing protein [Vampirovibrionales bacterium]|nr:lysylphosphatidylglycerol synthase transmembrane domain-containing protein [Vampirovibrionales bacterium]
MRGWKALLKIVISLGLLVALVWFSGVETTLKSLQRVPVGTMLGCMGVYFLSQAISAYRWQQLSATQGFEASYGQYLRWYLMGMFFSMCLPGSMGGDGAKVLWQAQACQRKRREAFLTVLAERGSGLLAMLWITGLACWGYNSLVGPSGFHLPNSLVWGMGGVGLLGFVGLVLWLSVDGVYVKLASLSRKVKALHFLEDALLTWRSPQFWVHSIGLSFVVQGLMVAIHLWLLAGFGWSLSTFYLTATYGVVNLLSILPIAFAGFGIREGGYQWFFTHAGFNAADGLAFALAFAGVFTAVSLLGGVVWFLDSPEEPRPEALESSV